MRPTSSSAASHTDMRGNNFLWLMLCKLLLQIRQQSIAQASVGRNWKVGNRRCQWNLQSAKFCVVRSYALGDLLEMAGYGLTQRAASNVRISGLCADPFKVTFTPAL